MSGVGDEGLEPIAFSPRKTAIAAQGGAKSGALSDGLALVTAAWPHLGDVDKREILGIVRRASEAAGQKPGPG